MILVYRVTRGLTAIFPQSFSDVLDDMDVDGQPVGSPAGKPTEQAFDCVICGQTSTSTENRPVGLVALLQPSAGQQNSGVVIKGEGHYRHIFSCFLVLAQTRLNLFCFVFVVVFFSFFFCLFPIFNNCPAKSRGILPDT